MKKTRKFKTKIEALKAFRAWLTKDKFHWHFECKCWDGLLINFINQTKSYEGGCLLSKRHKEFHIEREPLYELGFTYEEMQKFEILIGFDIGSSDIYKQTDTTIHCHYEIYEIGIEYLNRWISSLEVKQVRYVTVKVDSQILVSALSELETSLN